MRSNSNRVVLFEDKSLSYFVEDLENEKDN